MMWSANPALDWTRHLEALEQQPHIPCSHCGEPLYVRTDMFAGDQAWNVLGEWYCEDCAEKLFKMEVEK